MGNNIIQDYCLMNNMARDQFWFRFRHFRQEFDFLENQIKNSYKMYPVRDQEYREPPLQQKKMNRKI